MAKKIQNYDLCQNKGLRCVHCCTVDYSFPKGGYDELFAKRSRAFEAAVKEFPGDIRKYRDDLKKERLEGFGVVGPCPYVGMIDSSPGCLIHPSRHGGLDVRADEELTGHSCLPLHGCYFNNYLRTRSERKIFREFMVGVEDWYDYSKNLRDCAVFNKQNGYILARVPPKEVSRRAVLKIRETIHNRLKKKFPRKATAFKKALEEFFPSPTLTEEYMERSELFVPWGFGAVLSERDLEREPHFEKRFKAKDFEKWGYHLDFERVLYIYKPLGEILPIQFGDVAITCDKKVKEAIEVADNSILRGLLRD